MILMNCDVAVIGAGPAGLAAAISAKKHGAQKVLLIERDGTAGGILQQCIHPGFGITYFKQELTGPEYAGRFIDELVQTDVQFLAETMVLEILPDGTIICMNAQQGIMTIVAKSVVLAMGCRERTRGNIQIPGTRPAGVYTAGAAQRLLNRQGEMVGRNVLILGSGDIGMIMARRMTLEGANVVAVVELADYLAGLTRNRIQCLDDFNIPLLLSHTVVRIVGNQRVEGVWVAQVDEQKRPIAESETFYPCDTLLLSVGLIPENELSRGAHLEISPITNGPVVNQYMQTSSPSIFASGNVVHVNDLADNVSAESERAGACAAQFASGALPVSNGEATCVAGDNIRYICPHKLSIPKESERVKLYFRVSSPASNVVLQAVSGDKICATHKTIKVSPGEMECIQINTADIVDGQIRIDMIQQD